MAQKLVREIALIHSPQQRDAKRPFVVLIFLAIAFDINLNLRDYRQANKLISNLASRFLGL
ncbi:hypothetical protein B9G53_11335 [Pseudanabaena sp. SR411]|nr:hypothetical protein B9G53_11335 [Pseudanabaena sp. SR411]